MELTELRIRLAAYNLTKVAAQTGIEYYKLRRIAKGLVKNPNYEDVCKIIEFFKRTGG